MSSEHLQDWVAWIALNVLIGVFTPMAGMGLMSVQNKATANSTKNKSNFVVDYFLPYRDGQLGYVAMAWCAAAVVELVRALIVKSGLGLTAWALVILLVAIVNAWVAALGASAPTAELAKPHTRAEAWRHYPNFRYSVYWTIAALIGSGVIHYITMPILEAKHG
ncbi:hypothetical protein [Paraburkholderia youngii]|uniref:Uncharacterized protein n=1 Tax=Paraburkholderia youngii TaxID=2782701 RepID=A0A7W8L931_9BURK|nr:hypothetical protein [Paraburkholderia youngii]MBB5402634.1 hypothetical protein [Paraburkholderia youngii]